ncbi:MAG: retroviral-like aspartic protease family protein [Candidatus Bathyarchaeia archaeon]
MGYVRVKATVRNIYEPQLQTELELIADTGAIYTIINRQYLEMLQIKPTGKRQFKIADGKLITRQIGIAQIEIQNEVTHSIVVFGEPEDAQVLGVTTLEELGLQVDPITGQLKPLELLLL